MTNNTTKKAAQTAENAAVLEILHRLPVNDEGKLTAYIDSKPRRLRSCSAEVYTLPDGTKLLKSYWTFIAAVLPDGAGVDFLRYVYGYTASSCKQVSKFFTDYSAAKVLRYRWI